MASERTQHGKSGQKKVAAIAQLAETVNSDHPIVAARQPSESERVNQIILSNLAARND